MKRKKRKVRKKKRGRLPISAATVKRLAFQCADIGQADTKINLPGPLAGYIERHEKLGAAWERGQLLRNLRECAEGIQTVTQAAKLLGFETGQELREILDSDTEVRDVWDQARIKTIAAGKKALVEAAKQGNQAAIRAIEVCLRDDAESPLVSGTDLSRMTVPQMADVFGIHRQTVYQWYNSEALPRNADGTFDLKTTIRWYGEFVLTKAARGRDITATKDPLRTIKAQQLALDLERQRGELLDRATVIAGQVARFDNIVRALDRLTREIATMVVNQPAERIKEILSDWRREVIAAQRQIPEELELPVEAGEALAGVYEKLASKDE